MKLTTKLLKEMIRKELHETFMQQKLGGDEIPDGWEDKMNTAYNQTIDYYDEMIAGGGWTKRLIRQELAQVMHSNANIPNELGLQKVLNRVMDELDTYVEYGDIDKLKEA